MKNKLAMLTFALYLTSCLSVTKKEETKFVNDEAEYVMEKLSVTDWRIETIYPKEWKVITDSMGVLVEMPKEFPSSFPIHAGYQISRYFPEDMNVDIIVGTREFLESQNLKILKDISFTDNAQQCHLFEMEIIKNDTTLSSQIYYRKRDKDMLRMNFTYIETYADMYLMFKHIWKTTK
jgi:hypothetical protein